MTNRSILNPGRRRFVAGAAAAAALLGVSQAAAASRPPFKIRYAPHDGLFRHSAGDDIVDQIEFAADAGFRAWEDNGMRNRSIVEQERMAAAMARREVQMGVFVGADIDWDNPTLTTGDAGLRDKFLADISASVNVAKRINATWMTILPGAIDPTKSMGFQTANVIEALKRASEILEPHGLVMALEPLNFVDHPKQFLAETPQAYMVCKAVDSPACKILFDIYHQQISEGNLIANIDAAWDEIVYFQDGDMPGAHEPGTGEINFHNIFRHIHQKGFRGIMGMEHDISISGEAGERLLIDVYRDIDDFAA